MKKLFVLSLLMLCIAVTGFAQIRPIQINNYDLSIQPAVSSVDTTLSGITVTIDSLTGQFRITEQSGIVYTADSLEAKALIIADSSTKSFSVDWYRSPSDTTWQYAQMIADTSIVDSSGNQMGNNTWQVAGGNVWKSSQSIAHDTLIAGIHKSCAILSTWLTYMPVRLAVHALWGDSIGWGRNQTVVSQNIDAKKYLVVKKK